VPLLRLPFPADISPPVDADTEVRMMLRPDSVTAVRAQLDALDPTLLLVLPGLSSLDIAGRCIEAVPDGEYLVIDGTRWRIAGETGDLGPEMLADRPVEERLQTRWSVTWAVPVDDSGIPQSLGRRSGPASR